MDGNHNSSGSRTEQSETTGNTMYNLRVRPGRKRKLDELYELPASSIQVEEDNMTFGLSDLPDLPLVKIFSYLSENDLKNLSFVCTRLLESGLRIDKRLRTWQMKLPDDLSKDTSKVLQYNLNLHVEIVNFDQKGVKNCDEIEAWLMKHSSLITKLTLRSDYWHQPEHKCGTLRSGLCYHPHNYEPETGPITTDPDLNDFIDKLMKPLLKLKQVRILELADVSTHMNPRHSPVRQDAVRTLLSGLGPQLRKLVIHNPLHDVTDLSNIDFANIRGIRISSRKQFMFSILKNLPATIEHVTICVSEYLDHIDTSTLNQLTNLKFLQLNCSTYNTNNATDTTFNLLQIVPNNIETLQISSDFNYSEFVEFPLINQLKNLRELELEAMCCEDNPIIPASLTMKMLSTSLTRLSLVGLGLQNQEHLESDLPAIKTIHLSDVWIKMSFLRNLMIRCSQSLDKLIMDEVHVCEYEDLDYFSLPALTKLMLERLEDTRFIPQLITACSASLVNLKMHNIPNTSFVDQLTYELPALKTLNINNGDNVKCNIDNLLKKCSSSLQILHLGFVKVNLQVNVPNLKELYLQYVNIQGFTNLVAAQGSRIGTIGIAGPVGGSLLNDMLRCKFPNLKIVYVELGDKDFGLKISQWKKLEKSLVTANVKVFMDDHMYNIADEL